MEPFTAGLSAAILSLIKLYESAHDALQTSGIGKEELRCIGELTVALTKLRGHRSSVEPGTKEQHVAVISAAFVRAYRQHWVGNQRLLERQRTMSESAITAAVARVVVELDTTAHAQLRTLDELLGSPLATPYYRCLWDEFTTGDEALLSVTAGTSKSAFEADFMANYATLASSEAGRQWHSVLDGFETRRTEILRMLVAQDTLSWMRRHIFGNVRQHAELGPMPLASMYVEPLVLTDDDASLPIQRWFEQQLNQSSLELMVVSADFGHGKSMSARYLACKLALAYLQSNVPGAQCWYPVYVRASDDLSATENNLKTIVARALRRQTNDPEGLQLGLSVSDDALAVPDGRALIIVDGFDEIALSPAEAERFFTLLRDESSARRRFVVLGRPESLREVTRNRERWHVALARIQGFEERHAQSWLERWNRHTPEREPVAWSSVRTGPLAELVRTPVLLFMVAFTLSDKAKRASRDPIGDTVALYEAFCFAMARGKLEQSGERHHVIEAAASRLADALESKGWSNANIPVNSQVAASNRQRLSSAMLWLMSRVAWEMFVRGEQPLRQRHIETLLEQVLELDDTDVDAVVVGSLLAIQSNLASGQAHMFFGHRSFQEYLAARFWHVAVGHVATLPSRAAQREFEGTNLIGSPLVRRDPVYTFFLELETNEVLPARRRAVGAWADTCFCDIDESVPITRQRRAPLRAAALAIACIEPGFQLTRPERREALIALVVFNWITLMLEDDWLIFAMPGADLEDIDIRASSLHHGLLSDARFARASLRYVNLGKATLRRADFSLADLVKARFEEADLQDAKLAGVMARQAFFRSADLSRANLTDARLDGADFVGANLQDACLRNADLTSADLRRANLRGADFTDANLANADLTGADVTNAKGLNLDPEEPRTAERSVGKLRSSTS